MGGDVRIVTELPVLAHRRAFRATLKMTPHVINRRTRVFPSVLRREFGDVSPTLPRS